MSEPHTAGSECSSSRTGLKVADSLKLLPTPTASDSHGGQDAAKRRAGGHQLGLNDLVVTCFPSGSATRPTGTWHACAPALHRWKATIRREAPVPVEAGIHGQPRLAARFVEWLMGLPAGHVTDLGLPRTAELRALGNGVVPQQAEWALRALLAAAPHHN